MLLAMLLSSGRMSEYAIEFMLENCSELNSPCRSERPTMAAVGVPGTTREKAAMVRPMSTVLTTSTRRKPKRASRWVEISFMVIAAAALGMISRPDCQAGRPRPIW